MKNNKFYQIWSKPLLLFIITCFGLLAALFGTGIWHFAAWITLFIPLITILHFTVKPK